MLVCFLALSAAISRADDNEAPTDTPAVDTRKYDIRPLLKNTRRENASDPGMKPRRPTDVVGVAIPTRQEFIDQFMMIVTEMVEPSSWKSAGGTVASMRDEEGFLVVEQTTEAHEQVSYVVSKLVRPGAKAEVLELKDGTTVRFYDVRAVRVGATGVNIGDGGTTTYYEAFEALAQRIRNECAPTTWRDADGTVGSLRGIGGVLIVRQTEDVQKQIEDLLRNASRK